MSQKNIIPMLLSLIAGVLATLVIFTFFFFYYIPLQKAKTANQVGVEKPPTPPKTPESTLEPLAEIKESDVNSLTIETVYKNFFAEGSKCRQTYNEYFKNTDGVGSSSSPCNVKLTLNRDGSAGKTIEVRRYDITAKEWRVVEKNVWKGKLSDEEFKGLARLIVSNEAFKDWSDMMMINVSNCKITVKHTNGSKSPMSNVDEKATAYLPMVNAFKELDAKIGWEKVE